MAVVRIFKIFRAIALYSILNHQTVAVQFYRERLKSEISFSAKFRYCMMYEYTPPRRAKKALKRRYDGYVVDF